MESMVSREMECVNQIRKTSCFLQCAEVRPPTSSGWLILPKHLQLLLTLSTGRKDAFPGRMVATFLAGETDAKVVNTGQQLVKYW
jgi:hypothetical protein